MPDVTNITQFKRAAGLMLGMDIAYNIGSFSLSAPQTTERRIKDAEGSSETPKESMKWVWLSTWKMLAYTALPSLIGRTIWPFLGGLIVVADVHLSYAYAITCGTRSKTPGGSLLGRAGMDPTMSSTPDWGAFSCGKASIWGRKGAVDPAGEPEKIGGLAFGSDAARKARTLHLPRTRQQQSTEQTVRPG